MPYKTHVLWLQQCLEQDQYKRIHSHWTTSKSNAIKHNPYKSHPYLNKKVFFCTK